MKPSSSSRSRGREQPGGATRRAPKTLDGRVDVEGDSSEDRNFSLRVLPARGLSVREEARFERDLAAFLEDRGMHAEGATLQMRVFSSGRELGRTDQADLLLWPFAQPAICGIELGPITSGHEATAPASKLGIGRWDQALEPALLLCRLGRLNSGTLLAVLSGVMA